MRALFGAVLACAAVVTAASLIGTASAVARTTPASSATGAAPITVVIPATSTPTPSATPRPSGTLTTLPEPEPTLEPGACVPAAANADGSPVPPASPRDSDEVERLELSGERVAADSWMIASATGFSPQELGQVVVYPGAQVIGNYTVGADGEFSARFRIPADAAPGAHVLEVTGWASGCVANAEFTVVAPGSGANWLSVWWVWIVVGGLSVGVLSLALTFQLGLLRWFARPPAGSAT